MVISARKAKLLNRQFTQRSGPLKLHIGFGTQYKSSWVNIDNNSDENIATLDMN